MRNRSNALLVELLIVIMFFMLASGILLEGFGKARSLSVRAEEIADAIASTQNVADRLYLAESPETELSSLGFTQTQEGWRREDSGYDVMVSGSEEQLAGGVIHVFEVTALKNGEQLVCLPVERYEEGMKP